MHFIPFLTLTIRAMRLPVLFLFAAFFLVPPAGAAQFGGTEDGVLPELRKYAGPDLAAALENVSGVTSYDYDWSLNDAVPENRK